MSDMDNSRIIALFGKSGAGKDAIQHSLVVTFLPIASRIKLYTTRPPRENEIGPDNIIISPYMFTDEKSLFDKQINGELVNYFTFNNWVYALPKDQIRPNYINIGVFSVAQIDDLIKNHPEYTVLPILIDTLPKIRLLRALHREPNPDCNEICRRFLADEADFVNIPFKYLIYDNNDRIDCNAFAPYINLEKSWSLADLGKIN